jgi:clan AA aspartic protease
MGLTHQKVIVKPAARSRPQAAVECLVDSGTSLTLVPSNTLKKLGVRPYRKESFVLANGTEMTRQIGVAYVEVNGKGATSDVIFGQRGDEPLLGMITLEMMGLVLDPFKRQLLPGRMMLARST